MNSIPRTVANGTQPSEQNEQIRGCFVMPNSIDKWFSWPFTVVPLRKGFERADPRSRLRVDKEIIKPY